MHSRQYKLGVSLPGVNIPLLTYPKLAKLAEDSGMDSVWGYECYRNSFLMQGLCANATSKIELGIGLAAAAQRSPFEMANAALDVDEISDGRLRLVFSTGGANFADHFNGVNVDRPATRMREYLDIMRMYMDHTRTGKMCEFEGEFYRFSIPPVNPFGPRQFPRPDSKLYLGALKPAMLRLSGEKADGSMGYLYTPSYIEQHIEPSIQAGLERAGRTRDSYELVSYLICSPHEDREIAMRRARIHVGAYAAYPVAEHIVEEDGLSEDRNLVLQALVEKGPTALEHVTSDALIEKYAIAGTPEECREQYEEKYKNRIDHIVLHTPYVPPLTTEESEDSFRQICNTFKNYQ